MPGERGDFFRGKPAEAWLSLVIPCFNEESAIPLCYAEALPELAALRAGFEFCFVDDGSTDRTLNVLRDLAGKDSRVHYISFSRSFGEEAALLAGLKAARGEYVCTLDADGQDPPRLIPEMLEAIISGEYDCAGTWRITRKGEPPVRSFFARRFYALMAKISCLEIVDGARDFRLMNRAYVNAVLAMPERNRFSKGLFPWAGFKTKWFEYENVERKAGETKWSFWKLFLYSLDGIIAFSTNLLELIAALFAILIWVYVPGIGKFVWQNGDHPYRNAIFKPLTEREWPVARNIDGVEYRFVYYKETGIPYHAGSTGVFQRDYIGTNLTSRYILNPVSTAHIEWWGGYFGDSVSERHISVHGAFSGCGV